MKFPTRQATKLLGIHSNLSWSVHVHNLLRNYPKVCMLSITLETLCTYMHFEHYIFCPSTLSVGLWYITLGLISHVFSCQKKVGIICQAGYRDHCRLLFQKTGVITRLSLYVNRSLLKIHKNKSQYSTHPNIYGYPFRCTHLITGLYRHVVKSRKCCKIGLSSGIETYSGLTTFLRSKYQTITLKYVFSEN